MTKRLPAAFSGVESLEARRLLAATTVGIYTKISPASETDPTGAGRGEAIVMRPTGSTAQPLTLQYYVRNTSTATSGVDFVPVLGTVTIRAGKRSAAISLFPIDDNVHESDETAVLSLWPTTPYTVVRRSTSLMIKDNDPSVTTTVGIYTKISPASETDPTGAGRGEAIVMRPTGSTAEPLTLQYYVRNTSTATSGVDFVPVLGTVTIRAGKRSAAISLFPIDDNVHEEEESVSLVLSPSTGYTVVHGSTTLTITDNDPDVNPSSDWWNPAWHYRAPLTVDAGPTTRIDKVIEQSVNFTGILGGMGKSGSLIESSLRVVEVGSDGRTVLDEDVPFQFDKAGDFDPANNASGTLIFIARGTTQAGQQRYYHVYFDTAGTFPAANVTPQVAVTDNVQDEGQACYVIDTQMARYYYQKQSAGFSSILDKAGHDWIGYSSTPGAEGEYRGLPNMGPAGFHPGRTPNATTVIVSQGPLKTVIESTTENDASKIRWEFYPTFARATVLKIDQNYYFLYEGTPGGAFDGNDFVVRSDGSNTPASQSWSSNLGANEDEWAYFGDSAVGKFLFLAHNTKDGLEDSYFDLNDQMTVFGFGRHNTSGDPDLLLTQTPNVFTIGVADGGTDVSAAGTLINGTYRDISATLGSGQSQ